MSVIGVPDAHRGESPKNLIKSRSGIEPFTLGALRSFLEDYLGKYEMPQAIGARAELPKTAAAKLSRKALWAEAAGKLANKSPK